MDITDQVNRIIDAEPNQDAQLLTEIFIGNRFVNDSTRYDVDEFIQITRDFLACARENFRIEAGNYLTERMSVETVFQTVMRAHRFPEELLPEATTEAVTAYFEWWMETRLPSTGSRAGRTICRILPGTTSM